MNLAPLFVIIIIWTIVRTVVDYLKKRGSKLAEDKPIYNKIKRGIYIVLLAGLVDSGIGCFNNNNCYFNIGSDF